MKTQITTMLGYSGDGPATDQDRGHDIVSGTTLAEEQRVSGVFAANTARTIQFIYETNCSLPPTLQINGGGVANISVKLYACLDRIPRQDNNQTESADVRAAHWVEVTAGFLTWTASGSTAFASTAATISSLLLSPNANMVQALRPNFFRITLTVDGSQGADAVDVYSHATSN
jgi:hypothetical protein